MKRMMAASASVLMLVLASNGYSDGCRQSDDEVSEIAHELEDEADYFYRTIDDYMGRSVLTDDAEDFLTEVEYLHDATHNGENCLRIRELFRYVEDAYERLEDTFYDTRDIANDHEFLQDWYAIEDLFNELDYAINDSNGGGGHGGGGHGGGGNGGGHGGGGHGGGGHGGGGNGGGHGGGGNGGGHGGGGHGGGGNGGGGHGGGGHGGGGNGGGGHGGGGNGGGGHGGGGNGGGHGGGGNGGGGHGGGGNGGGHGGGGNGGGGNGGGGHGGGGGGVRHD